MMKVVCGVVYKNDKVLLCKRKSSKQLGGFWEFPGGKLELNEKPEVGLKRELLEELSMSVEILSYFTTIIHEYENFTIELIAYKCKYLKGISDLTDHDKFLWLEVNELINKKLSPADIPITEKLMNNK